VIKAAGRATHLEAVHFALTAFHISVSRSRKAHQKSFDSGPESLPLRLAQKGRFTQAEIAARAGLSVPTVRLLERGTGTQASKPEQGRRLR
jgi:hypothetical protein